MQTHGPAGGDWRGSRPCPLIGIALRGGSPHTYRMAEADEIAVLRIELQGIEPLIWRRVAVRTSISLMHMHRVIQVVMGWLDSHLWELEANGRKYAMHLSDEPEWNERYGNAESVLLSGLLNGGTREMEYVYDIGDNWEHSIIVERVAAPLPNVAYPQFLGGERRCPPEDCGGISGYREFLKNVASKKSATRKSALDWHGGAYDPDDIGEQRIVTALRSIGEVAR